MLMPWRESPPDDTMVCGGFDGSTTFDLTAIKLETFDGLLFTPRYGPDRRPTIWDPAEWGGSVPRHEVHAAWDEIHRRYQVERVYCDPWHWQSEIETWGNLYGEAFVSWHTNRERPMHAALDRFTTDLRGRRMTHDGCPITTLHVSNATKVARPADRYILGKPSDTQHIDAAMASVLAHEAASDARAAGWEEVDSTMFVFQ